MNASRTHTPVRREGHVARRAYPRLEHLEDRTLLDVGDTLATALNTQLGPPPGTYDSPTERLGDGKFSSRDVDLYRFEANAGARITARTERPPGGQEVDTILRLFNDAGQQLAFNDDCPGGGLYSCINNFNLPGAGIYYAGVSGFPNFNYNPNVGGSGTSGKAGDFRLTLILEGDVPDIGDTLAEAEVTNLGPGAGTYTLPTQPIGNGPFGNRDVDLFVFEADEGILLTATTEQPPDGAAMDTILRVFDAKGQELAANDDCEGTLYSCLNDFSIPATGTYYAGVSGFANSKYDPTVGGSGIAGSTGDFSVTLTLTDPGGAPSPGGSDRAATIGILQSAPTSVHRLPALGAAGAPSAADADLPGPDSAAVDRLFTAGPEEHWARPWDRRLARTGGLHSSSVLVTGELLDDGLTEVVFDLHRAGSDW